MSPATEPTAPPPGRPTPVAIAGAGAAGTLVAFHLARVARRRDVDVAIALVDPGGPLGASAAFGTDDERHLLNVPASGMSALPDDPGHFLAWRNDELGEATDPYDFVPRRDFAHYLRACLDAAVAAAPAHLDVRRASAVGATPTPDGVCVTLDDGTALDTSALVVATGLGTPSTDWAPPELHASPRFIADPWAPGALEALRATAEGPADVLVVGAGLTMIDIVLSCHDTDPERSIHAISRTGELPHLHAAHPVTPLPVDTSAWGDRLDDVRAHLDAHVRASLVEHDDWRPAIDGLRAQTASLWARLSDADRAKFLARDAGEWNRARHRTPRNSADRLDALEAEGRFGLTAARVGSAEPLAGGGLRVELDDGTHRDVGWVVNAAGPRTDVASLGNPLLDDLLEQGLAIPATAGMGFRTDDGRLVGRGDTGAAPIFTLGALRRGELWESTAVPEIRTQAAALAESLLGTREPSNPPDPFA